MFLSLVSGLLVLLSAPCISIGASFAGLPSRARQCSSPSPRLGGEVPRVRLSCRGLDGVVDRLDLPFERALLGRRSAAAGLSAAAAAALSLGLLSGAAAAVAAAAGPIVVLGAGGRTGRQCVRAVLDRGQLVVATSRTGELDLAASPQCKIVAADVTRPETLRGALAGARGVIFAASQSKGGGSANAVDNEGLVNTAKACIEAGVKRLVIVSSGAVSRPDSSVYQFLNLFGNIMAEKIAGEDRVRAMYAALPNNDLGYTIVRPGGLSDAEARGVGALELGQGDKFSGRISRADVADLSIASIDSDAARNATFECFYADTAKPLEAVGLSNMMKQTVQEGSSGGLRGSSWSELLAGLRPDVRA